MTIKPQINNIYFFTLYFLISVNCTGFTTIPENETIEFLLIKGDYEKVVEILKPVVQKEPGNRTAHYNLGIAYQQLNMNDKAVLVLEKAARNNRNNIQIMTALGKSYSMLDRYRDAEKTFLEILKIDQNNKIAQLNLGKIYLNIKRFKQAYKTYKDLQNHDSNNSFFYKQLGICAENMDSLKQAIYFFQQARKINFKDLGTYIHLYNIHFKLEDLESALGIVNTGLDLYPANILLRKSKAEILFKTADYTKALKLYHGLMADGDSTANTYKKLGMSYYYINEVAPALLALGIAFDKDSTDALIAYYYGLTNKKLNNHNKSIKLMNQALKLLVPEYLPDIYEELAESYEKVKNYPEAIRTYKKVLELDEKRILPLFFLASLYERYYADPKVALEYYERFLAKAARAEIPHVEYAKERINKIKEKQFFQNPKDE